MPKAKPQSKPAALPKNPAVRLASKTLASLPALSDAARAAFAEQTTPQERAALGGRTKSANLLREAGNWLTIINRAIAKDGGSIRYGSARVAYLCETILALDAAMNEARGARTEAVTSSARREAAMQGARVVRDDLLEALAQVTLGTSHAAELADIERDRRHDDQLAVALDELAGLLDRLLARAEQDAKTAALTEAARLSRRDLAHARAAREAIVAAGSARVEAGARLRNDPREVNLAEGALLAEMRVAKRAFDAARARTAAVPQLVAGAATRAVFGPHRSGRSPKGEMAPAAVVPPAEG